MAQKAAFKKVYDGNWQMDSVGRNKRKDGKRNRRAMRHNLKREAQKRIQEES